MAPPTCGNPLLQQWMKEEMLRSQQMSSKMYYTYKKAYDSLSKCPIVFEHPYQAVQLDGIGPKIVDMLTDKLKEYCREHGLPMPPAPHKAKRKRPPPSITDDDDIQLDENGVPIPFRPKKNKTKAYVPKLRSGGYGILLALLDLHDYGRCDATQQQIIRLAQDHCDASYTLADPGKNYTAWNSMALLVNKSYVYKSGSPKKYQLTETGVELAQKLKEINASLEGRGSSSASASTSTTPRSRPAILPTSSGAAFAAAIGSDSEDDDHGIDMSHYVLNPEQYSSISINGRTSTAIPASSNPSTARSRNNRSRFDDNDDLSGIDWDAIDRQEQEQWQQQGRQASPPLRPRPSTSSSRADILEALAINESASGSGRKRATHSSRSKKANNGGARSTASIFESLLDSMGGEGDLSKPDMSLYVMNPSQHQSISLNGVTATNNNNNPSSPSNRSRSTSSNIPNRSTASSVTNASPSSFARRVISQTDDEDDNTEWIRPRKYKTPASSSILMNDAAAKNKQKRQYNVDEYELDLTADMSSLLALNSTQLAAPSSSDIVDLLSSPETSPRLGRTSLQDEKELTFDDPFDPDQDYFPMSQSRNRQIVDDTFHFTYLDTDSQPQRHVAKAAVDIDDVNGGLAYLVKYQTKQGSHPKAQRLIKRKVEGEFTLAYLPEVHGETVCPGLPATPVLPLHREEEDSFWPASTRTTSSKRVPVSAPAASRSSLFASESQTRTVTATPSQSTLVGNKTPPFTATSHSPMFADDSQPLFPSASSQNDIVSQPFFPSQQPKKQDLDALVAREPITETLRPGEYEIVLVLDSREIQMKQNRTYFQDSLTAKGVPCITRSLDLGDVMWIARPMGSSTHQAEELFLDYIVERKRLDDLVSSIKDGRFIEQKTRLKRSGANKVIYVVENYNREEAERFGLQAVQTAMSSTQIIDGIFLKRTNTIDETVDYLVSATKLVKRMYQDYTLHAIPGHIITRQNYLDLKQAYNKKAGDKEAYLVSHPLFAQLNSKQGSTSVHQVYLRMLMTIRGVNAEKALSLMKVYPTPKSLLTAFQGKSPEDAKHLAKVATQDQINRRRWGVKISESLYDVWGALKYPDSDDDELGGD